MTGRMTASSPYWFGGRPDGGRPVGDEVRGGAMRHLGRELPVRLLALLPDRRSTDPPGGLVSRP